MQSRIGLIGQGWIGKNYADDFERRGYDVVRYALEEPYAANKEKIAECDIVFIAVPTPTTSAGFDDSILVKVFPIVGTGKIAVIKSTIVPGTTERLQKKFPELLILHAPEFLREASAARDASEPARNLIGIPLDSDAYRSAAEQVLAVLPEAPYTQILSSREAELVKYAGNVFLMMKVLYANMLYDLAAGMGTDYEKIRDAVAADPRIGPSHLSPIDASGHTDKAGRGAGGHCFIKDFEAYRRLYRDVVHDPAGDAVLTALVEKNVDLLTASGKDVELLRLVYGE
ncbi:MAG: UDPglucose 6-dehydrogenase [Parcubacteria group bacterium]|nr:UDPglucose 6-dehydrogenase [Parcubacteria group bacterium]